MRLYATSQINEADRQRSLWLAKLRQESTLNEVNQATDKLVGR